MSLRRQSRDVPRCTFPWQRRRSHKRPYRNKYTVASSSTLHIHDDRGQAFENGVEEDHPNYEEIRRLMSPTHAGDSRYSSLARAAGIQSPAPTASTAPSMARNTGSRSFESTADLSSMANVPPPLPAKKLAIDTALAKPLFATASPPRHTTRSRHQHQPSQLSQLSRTPTETPELTFSASRLTPPMQRSISPLTPLSAGSFSRNRAGSTLTKGPPPPLDFANPSPRKGSLPGGAESPIKLLNEQALAAALRTRSASLPMDSLFTHDPKHPLHPVRHVLVTQGTSIRGQPSSLSTAAEEHSHDKPAQSGIAQEFLSAGSEVTPRPVGPLALIGVNLPSGDESPLLADSLTSSFPAKPKTPSPPRSSARKQSGVTVDKANTLKSPTRIRERTLSRTTDDAKYASPPVSANSAARASSIISISQSTFTKKLQYQRLQQENQLSGPDQVEINYRHSGHSSYLPPHSHRFPSSPRRSDVESVPHDQVYTPRNSLPSLPSHHGHRDMLSGSSEKSFDLMHVPFTFRDAPPMPCSNQPTARSSNNINSNLHLMPTTPTTESHGHSHPRSPLSPSRKHYSQTSSHYTSQSRATLPPRSPSIKSSKANSERSLRSRAKRSSKHACNSLLTPRFTASVKRSSTSLAHLLAAEPRPRPFPWKAVRVSEAKKQLTQTQLQQLVLQSMREYGSTQKHSLVLERFEEIPLELEQCEQRIPDLEEALTAEIEAREAILKRHVACLRVLNGEQGARFGESLVTAVSRSDTIAQELCQLREHIGKIERLRDGHWRAAASLSLAKLNSSYLKAKDQVREQGEELKKLREERDAAIAEAKYLKDLRVSVLSVPTSTATRSGDPTPSSTAFDYTTFPVPPQREQMPVTPSPPISRSGSQKVDFPTAAPEPAPSRATSDTASGAVSNYRFPAPVSPARAPSMTRITRAPAEDDTPFCSQPTPHVVDGLMEETRSESSASQASFSTFRFRALRDRVFAPSKAQSTPPPESELPWARLTDPSPEAAPRQWRSNSTPAYGPTSPTLLDPHADQFAQEVETLKFVPPSMHLSGAMDDVSVSVRSSLDPGRSPVRENIDGAPPGERLSIIPLEKVEINDLLTELGEASQFVPRGSARKSSRTRVMNAGRLR